MVGYNTRLVLRRCVQDLIRVDIESDINFKHVTWHWWDLIEMELPKQAVSLGHRTLPLEVLESKPGWLLKVVPTEETTSRPTSPLKTLLSGTGIGRKFSPTPCVSWSLHLLLPSSPVPWLPIDCLLPTPSSAARSSIHPNISLVPQCCR